MKRNEADLFKQALMKSPDIVEVAPKNSGSNNNTVRAGADKDVNIVIETIDASYLPLLKVLIVAGRNFFC